MRFARPLIPGRLIRRYKRFLADVVLDNGRAAVAHCPNPGAMLGLAEPGMRVWLEPNDDPGRKLRLAWRLVELPGGHLAGIDTGVPNKVAAEALKAGLVPGLDGYAEIRPEVRFGTNSRADFRLTAPGLPPAWVEVKNVHLRRAQDWAEFPDCVTARGLKHLRDLADRARAGERAVMLYVVQRSDCARFRLAGDLDPAYAAGFDAARAAGVEMRAIGTAISLAGVAPGAPLPVDPGAQACGAATSGNRHAEPLG
jgi:sugar fermentation stimulation protein A